MKRVIGILVIVILASAGFWYWHSHKSAASDADAKKKGPQIVVAAPLVKRDLTVTINTVGSLLAGEQASIHAEIAGQIKEILFQEGQPVKKGDMLIKIDSSLIETDLAKAKAALDAANANMVRDDKLKTSGFVADQQVESSRAAQQGAEAAVANAQITLDKTTIRAPFDGIAGLRSFSQGDYATAGQQLTSVVSLDPLKLEFTVPEKNYAAIKQGQTISFSVDAFPSEKFPGSIYAVDPQVNAENRNFTVKASIPNKDGRLRPGMYARIAIDIASRPGALMAPEEAVVPQGDDAYLFVVNGTKAARKKVTLGERQEGEVEIVDGIAPEDRVITAGVMKLHDGSDVSEQTQAEAAP